ncbi:hypothetical protein RN001_000315 [Aquatica leii]|uniref:Coiled-coil domain-containing protein 112 n=1 Tax=Aquatica leii TaxID=1421715 RepID=A0AAN7Q2U9_9COLE|nr:hypothetical protein RN001_000315 [Aquatica leii]
MSSFIYEITKLKNIQQYLEKHGNAFIDNCSKSGQNIDLCELRSENAKSRQTHQDKLQNDILNIMNPLKRINDSLKKRNLNKLDVKTVKKDMTSIQSNIKKLNDSSQASLEDLKKEERILLNNLQGFQQKIEKWEKRNGVVQKSVKRTASKPENISTEAKTFMQFVTNTGGHENGWNIEDHGLFLRLRSKVKDKNKLAEMVHAMLPDISEKEVLAHEAWYVKYLELRELQKNSIKNWRESKSNVQSTSSNNSPEKTSSKIANTDCFQKDLVHEKLQAWKMEKLLQSKHQNEQRKQEIAKKKEEEEARKQKQEELRAQVNNWKIMKKQAEEEEKLRKEEEEKRVQKERAAKANKLIKEFQNHDELFIQHKLQLLHGQNKLPQIVPQKNYDETSRDRSRILQPTQQWMMKKYTGPSRDNCASNMNVQSIPKLRMPEWRKYIT